MFAYLTRQIVMYTSRQTNLATAKVAPMEAVTGEHTLFIRLALLLAALVAFAHSEALSGHLDRYDEWIRKHSDPSVTYARFHG